MKYPAEMYLMKPEQFADMLKWERFAGSLKKIVKAVYLTGLENQVEDIKKGTVRA